MSEWRIYISFLVLLLPSASTAATVEAGADGKLTCLLKRSATSSQAYVSWESSSNKRAIINTNALIHGTRGDDPSDHRLFKRGTVLKPGDLLSVAISLPDAKDAPEVTFFLNFVAEGNDQLYTCSAIINEDKKDQDTWWSDLDANLEQMSHSSSLQTAECREAYDQLRQLQHSYLEAANATKPASVTEPMWQARIEQNLVSLRELVSQVFSTANAHSCFK